VMSTNETDMFHGKFIPNDPNPLPLSIRILIGVGLAALIFVILMLSVNVLQSWGEWVTVLIVAGITGSALALWVQDAVRHPATSFDEENE
jgi:hypothetical protein